MCHISDLVIHCHNFYAYSISKYCQVLDAELNEKWFKPKIRWIRVCEWHYVCAIIIMWSTSFITTRNLWVNGQFDDLILIWYWSMKTIGRIRVILQRKPNTTASWAWPSLWWKDAPSFTWYQNIKNSHNLLINIRYKILMKSIQLRFWIHHKDKKCPP